MLIYVVIFLAIICVLEAILNVQCANKALRLANRVSHLTIQNDSLTDEKRLAKGMETLLRKRVEDLRLRVGELEKELRDAHACLELALDPAQSLPRTEAKKLFLATAGKS